MDPHLARLKNEITDAINQLTPAQMTISRPGKWSIAEILEHLYLTYTGTTKGFGRVLSEGRSLATNATWKQRGQAFVVVSLGYMPTGRKSPAVAVPRSTPAGKISADIITAISSMDEVMNKVSATFGARSPILDHPILGPFSVHQWRKFHLVHGLHHIRQIRSLREYVRN